LSAVAIRQAPFWRDPVEALSPFADEPYAVLLLGDGTGWSYLLRAPRAVLDETNPDPLAALEALHGGLAAGFDPDGPPFQGGIVGLAAYELAARIEPLTLVRTGWPDLFAAAYDSLLAFDGRGRRVLAIGRGREAQARAAQALSWLEPPPRPPLAGRLSARFEAEPAAGYEAAVAEVVRGIGEGEIFQANIARAWRGALAPGATPFDLFARLARQSPAPFAAYLRLPGRALVSNSPERFLAVADGAVESLPIKGTAPRRADPAADAAQAAALLASEKDRAENLMIVDLMRNDLSRVCEAGSVTVPRLFALRSFANVHHLVSTVRGRLAPGATVSGLLRAAFPPGSITGAPKVQAMKRIAALEAPRGPYCGSLFRSGPARDGDWAFDSSVLIRTALLEQDADAAGGGWRLEARAGAGIVADSDPAAERRETEAKIAAIAQALTQAALTDGTEAA
jgi:para-aminobenzoate synthetase component 1